MPNPPKDKTNGKRRIMRLIEPSIHQMGFLKHRQFGYVRPQPDKSEWRLLLSVPTHDCVYRICPSIMHADGSTILGPSSNAYEAPNSPNNTRYNFRFHVDADTHDRCAKNILQWLNEVAFPWFRSQSN